MHSPSSPMEAFHSAARSLFGRMFCFLLACSLGGGFGYLVHQLGVDAAAIDFAELGLAMSVVPAAVFSVLMSYGAITYTFSLLIGFLFIRYELSFWFLAGPFALVGWQTYLILQHAGPK
jgi:hypothetical protein